VMQNSPGQRTGYVLRNTPAAADLGLDQPLRMKVRVFNVVAGFHSFGQAYHHSQLCG
jgi:hypothetical protein